MSNANEPAFPQCETAAGNPLHTEFASGGGLTKREYFAAMLMQGMVANSTLRPPASSTSIGGAYANDAVMLADALLAALAKEPAK